MAGIREKGLLTASVLVVTVLAAAMDYAYPTHVSSVKYAPYSEIEAIPFGCSSDGKRCADVYVLWWL